MYCESWIYKKDRDQLFVSKGFSAILSIDIKVYCSNSRQSFFNLVNKQRDWEKVEKIDFYASAYLFYVNGHKIYDVIVNKENVEFYEFCPVDKSKEDKCVFAFPFNEIPQNIDL